MSLVTRCPNCSTAFKVVRDQLRISDGWVRCGRCSQVFDATADLQHANEDGTPVDVSERRRDSNENNGTGEGEPSRPSPAPAAPVQASDLLSSGMPLPAMNWPAADMLDLDAAPRPAPLPTAPPARVPLSPSSPDTFIDSVPVPSLRDDSEPWLSASAPAPLSTVQASSRARLEPYFSAPEGATLVAPSPIEEAVNAQLQKALRRERVKALRRERAEQKERERESAAQKPALADSVEVTAPLNEAALARADAPTLLLDPPAQVRASRKNRLLWIALCVLALLALLLQVVRHERDTLLARDPQLRPALQQLCELTHCELSALRQIGSITIDGASFVREKEGDGYRFNFTLRNGARVPLAMPAVELSLLDTQERIVVRRVLTPVQFDAPVVLAAGAERSASLPIELVESDASQLPPVAGYRVVAFYP